jgi:hypothetical protein
MNRLFAAATLAACCVVSSPAWSQAASDAAPAAAQGQSNDPFVKQRDAIAAANADYQQKVAAAKKIYNDKVDAASDVLDQKVAAAEDVRKKAIAAARASGG